LTSSIYNSNTCIEPGGYIQWLEADHSKSQILHNKAGAPAAATKEIYREINAWFKDVLKPAAATLSGLFEKNGLEVVAEDIFATDRLREGTAYHTTMLTKTAGALVGTHLVKTGKKTQQQVDELISKAVEESKDGDIYQHSECYVVIGRKKQ
jgi:hypothetical protein